jgi:pSer/pThr/pTyr-binding forkhead associated (FHA) protein
VMPKAKLLVKPDREIQLSRSAETVIGRDSTNVGYVDDRQVSRHHAKISCVDGEFWIEDLNSLNGTRVNGATVSKQKLADNDQINVGDTILTFAIDS